MAEGEHEDITGGSAGVLARAARLQSRGVGAGLALVLETEGSTYVDPGAMALFTPDGGQHGWLSGGCLEPEIARRALDAAGSASVRFLAIDTREDEDLFSGSALGCRGRLLLALLPVAAMPPLEGLLARWRQGAQALDIGLVPADSGWRLDVGGEARIVPGDPPDARAPGAGWRLRLPALPEVLAIGAGPESPLLLPLLRQCGWRVRLVEARERWLQFAALADAHETTLADALARRAPDAALVMQHHFERDREALELLAAAPPPYVGLLGPHRRREDLFRVLPAAARETLDPVLHSPVGLPLGGRGPEAIALSIAAELQAWRHGRG